MSSVPAQDVIAMTSSSRTSNGQPSVSTAAERPRSRARAAWSGAERGDGTLISIDLAARLLGIRLLTLRAEVRVAPAPFEVVQDAAPPRPLRVPNGRPVGGGLADAERAIRSGARDLEVARRSHPV